MRTGRLFEPLSLIYNPFLIEAMGYNGLSCRIKDYEYGI